VKGDMSSHHQACEEKTEIPNRSRPNPEMVPEEIPKAAKGNPDDPRDLVGISGCKSFRFRDHKKILFFKY
jgi:hypothetical protein